AFGLAILSKTSSLMAAPMLVAIALVGAVNSYARERRSVLPSLKSLTVDALIGAGCTIAVWIALWPAMWVAPIETLRRVLDFTVANSSTPPEAGNFFFGAVVDDPGPLFYPVALAFRTTPLACLGLSLLVGRTALRGRNPRAWWLAGGLLACSAFFLLEASGSPKKFDRYALP